jgi:uncharacterized repeat protein (TIGR03803 family)
MFNQKYTVVRSLALTIFTAALVGPCAWGQTFKILHAFGNTGDGLAPQFGQVFDGQGNLYGVTDFGPSGSGCNGDGCGTVYQLKPNSDGSWTETVIHAFDGSDGAFPESSPIFDSQGNLDGSTSCVEGSCFHAGFVYQLLPGSDGTWTESVLHQFSGSWDGGYPGELTLDAAGNIYGTTRFGGLNDAGTVFSLNRSSGWQEQLLHVFDGYPSDGGGGPYGAITFDANGNLYGTTLGEGAYNSGIVFKLTKQGSLFWQQTVLYAFTGASDGNAPLGVVFGPDGSLYGVTQGGGYTGGLYCVLGCGTVFKLTPNSDGTWTETVLYAFRGPGLHDGATPTQRITFDRAGNIYGTTAGGSGRGLCSVFGCAPCGANGCGTVFKLTPSSGGQWTESIVYSFSGGLDGFKPVSPLAIDGAGNLYGTAANGGLYNYGVAYEITP